MKKQINARMLLAILPLACLLLVAGCSGGQSDAGQSGSIAATPATTQAVTNADPTTQTQLQAATPPSSMGADLANFDPCSVVDDAEYKNIVIAAAAKEGVEADDTIAVTHKRIADPSLVAGVPGSKACEQTWSSPISGQASQSILFLPYDTLASYKAGSKPVIGFEAAGGDAFDDYGSKYINKNGYLFTVGGKGSSESVEVIRLVMIGIANRIPSH